MKTLHEIRINGIDMISFDDGSVLFDSVDFALGLDISQSKNIANFLHKHICNNCKSKFCKNCKAYLNFEKN